VQTISDVNVGGIHHKAGRTPRLRYVFLNPDEERELSSIADHGVRVTAQDVPNARQVSMAEILVSKQAEEKSA
jgi:mannose/fructose/N-acetylgalactosamine-specific phosphotransferase system component IIB